MSGFVKRNSVNTVNPAGGVNPAQSPNVGQYGWTSFDAKNVNQIIEYVNLCKEYAQNAKDSADYVELRFGELQEFMNFIEVVYNELKPIIDQIQPIYQDIITRHEDVITRHIDVIRLHNLVTADKIDIDQIKTDTIAEFNVIKGETIAEANAIKAAAIAETTAIKVLATAEADRAKNEADRSAAEAVKSADSATASATSATLSGTEAGKAAQSAKDAAEIAEELRKGQVYRGTWNIQANGRYPDTPDTNSVWDITLNEGSTEYRFDNTTWFWGDRLLYLKDDNKFSQIESGSGVLSVNGKSGAVTLTATDVDAIPISGGTTTGMLFLDGGLTMKNNYIRGANDAIMLRDHGNGNVTLSASKNAAGDAGDLYLGYNGTASGTGGYNSRTVRVQVPMNWSGSKLIVNDAGINSEFMQGPIRTEVDSGNVWHTIVGGTDTVNRGRMLIAAGECGKVLYDNTSSSAESVHIGGDGTDGVYVHTGLQSGWNGAAHQRYQFKEGDIYSQAMAGTTINRFYHTGHKPTPTAIGAITKAGDTGIGPLTLARGNVLDATLTHQSGYMSIYPYNSNYGSSGNRLRMYYKEHNNGNPSDISRGLVINSNDTDGSSHPMDIWVGGHKVYHGGNKPTAADLGFMPVTGGTFTGAVGVPSGFSVAGRNVMGADANEVRVGDGSYERTVALAAKDGNVFVRSKAGEVMKVYHEGFKPDIADLLGSGSTTNKTITFTKPSGVVDGKFYPILFNKTTNYPDVTISTASAAASSSMNNCSFKGQVMSGGWSDKGRYVSGDFLIYSADERAIHSIVGASESDNHYVIYVEARAFPLTVVTNSVVEVSSTGKDVIFGTTTYKAGISDMTASGDYGTKTSLLMDFNRGAGFYSGQALRTAYIDAKGGVNTTDRINVFDYNNNGAFITRRPGKTSYSMMGQDSNGNTMLGLGVDTSGYSSYLKVSATTLAYSTNGSSESRVYHEGFKPSLGELGGIASTGGTMTGALIIDVNTPAPLTVKGGTSVGVKFTASGRDRYLGIDSEGYLVYTGSSNLDAGNRVYHSSNKPSASDIGAISTAGGRMTGKLQIYGASSQLEIIENDQAAGDKTWRMEAQNNNLDFTESGVATRLRLHAGGGSTFSGNMAVGGHLTINQGNILKFPSANYATGAQIYTRDGGQYGSNFVINTGGNMILGAGECGTALADIIGAASTEHAYVAADGDVYIVPGANTIADRKTHTFSANGDITLNAGATVARIHMGSSKTYVARSASNLYVAANEDNGRVYLEGKLNPNARVNGVDYTIYHTGNLPTFSDLSAGKAIGSSTALGVVDLDDYKTPGVYHQGSNAQATSGMNYPEQLAGSLVVYQAAGIIQEYRIYNTSRVWSRAQYSSGAWTAWVKQYNSANKPTAADVSALPLSGGTLTGRTVINTNDPDPLTLKRASQVGMKFEAGSNIRYFGVSDGGNLMFGNTTNHGTNHAVYHQGFKPTAVDVGAMPIGGGTFTNQVVLSTRKSSMVVANQTSIRFSDQDSSWYHHYMEGSQLKWSVGNDSAQTQRMVLDTTGNLTVSGTILAGNNISTVDGASILSGGIFRTTRATNPMMEWHKPGISAYIQYIDSGNNLRIGTSNGAGSEAAGVMSISPSQTWVPAKYTSTLNTTRVWTAAGHAAFYNDAGGSLSTGTYHAHSSLYAVYSGHYAMEMSLGYYCANTSWADGKNVIHNYNASTGETSRWFLGNNGTIETLQGGWRITGNGSLTGSVYGGGTIAEWVQRNFAPASDGNLKSILGESKTSALEQVSKMKFHEYVWNDDNFAKKDVKINKIGVIAQDMEEIDANYTRDVETFSEDGSVETSIKTLDTANLLAVALKAIQELEAKVATLEEKLNGLV